MQKRKPCGLLKCNIWHQGYLEDCPDCPYRLKAPIVPLLTPAPRITPKWHKVETIEVSPGIYTKPWNIYWSGYYY